MNGVKVLKRFLLPWYCACGFFALSEKILRQHYNL